MKIGERVQVKAYKSDGTCYRWWVATVEAAEPEQVVLISPVGSRVEGIDGSLVSKHVLRTYYWPDKWYILAEVFASSGRLVEIYVNINSPVEMGNSQFRFTDYELDVIRFPPDEARLVDEDEFQEAVPKYGYSEEFQQACFRVAREALDVANGWVAGGMPADAS